MNKEKWIQAIRDALARRDIRAVRILMEPLHAADQAEVMEALSSEECLILFRYLPKNEAAELFAYLNLSQQKELIQSFNNTELSQLVDQLYVDEAIDLLEELPANAVEQILSGSTPEKRAVLNRFLRYEEDSAGSVMSEELIRLKPEMKVSEAIMAIRSDREKLASAAEIYVTTADKQLLGVLSIRELLRADDDELIQDIMTPRVISVQTDTDQEEALSLIRKYDFLALPVTDSEMRLVGVITIDDALDISEEEASEDFAIMAAMAPAEASYLETGVLEHAKNRLPWLLILMVSGMLNGLILGGFEGALVSMPVLFTFVPMLTDTGGNSGSQSSTMVIRGLALGEIEVKQLPSVLWKEFRISCIVGFVLSVVCFLRVVAFPPHDPLVGLTVALTVFAVVLLSKLCGGLLPLAAKKLGLDPALMAAPLITTIVDAGALVIFFTMAKAIFGI